MAQNGSAVALSPIIALNERQGSGTDFAPKEVGPNRTCRRFVFHVAHRREGRSGASVLDRSRLLADDCRTKESSQAAFSSINLARSSGASTMMS